MHRPFVAANSYSVDQDIPCLLQSPEFIALFTTSPYHDGFGGLVVSVLAPGSRVRGFEPICIFQARLTTNPISTRINGVHEERKKEGISTGK
jgi:hypothetical protein